MGIIGKIFRVGLSEEDKLRAECQEKLREIEDIVGDLRNRIKKKRYHESMHNEYTDIVKALNEFWKAYNKLRGTKPEKK